MPAVQRDRENGKYIISARLVHGLIVAIFSALLGIAGWMVVWAANDSKWKGGMQADLQNFERALGKIEAQLAPGVLPRADERLRALELDVVELRSHLESMRHTQERNVERLDRMGGKN